MGNGLIWAMMNGWREGLVGYMWRRGNYAWAQGPDGAVFAQGWVLGGDSVAAEPPDSIS